MCNHNNESESNCDSHTQCARPTQSKTNEKKRKAIIFNENASTTNDKLLCAKGVKSISPTMPSAMDEHKVPH